MKNNQKHLDPDTVLWFKERGVEFGETTCVWMIDEDNYTFLFPRESHIMRKKSWSVIPAPNLQEVLEVLPKYIEYIGGTLSVKFLPPSAHYKECPVFRYVDISNIALVYFGDENPLIAAPDLLKWVVENHPESLIKK